MAFKIGDTVYLKSGGPAMSVTEVIGATGSGKREKSAYWVAWFAGKKNEKAFFPEDALTATDPTAKE